jgi:hypothetical protein
MEWEFIHQPNDIIEPFRDFHIFFEGQKNVTLSRLPVQLETLRRHLDAVAAELDDRTSPRRTRREIREFPGLVKRLRFTVEKMRETLAFLCRDVDECFLCDCDLEGRLCGVPTKAWHAVLLDPWTKNLLSFLGAEGRRGCWAMTQDEAIRRAIDTCEPDDLAIESDDEEDQNLLGL